MSSTDTKQLASEIYTAHQQGQPVAERPSSRDGQFDLAAAYQVVDQLAGLHRQQGHATNGRKIGFTNRAVWPRLDLDTIVWGYTFDDTVHYAGGNQASFSLAKLIAPRIEPEVVFKLKTPLSEADASDPLKVLEAVEWMALGFEIVDCPYPNWRFRPADMVAAFGFHAALVIGEAQPLGDLAGLAAQLAGFKLQLLKNGATAAEGVGSNVFDSPALCLGQLARTLHGQTLAAPLAAGEVITSGTVTDAQPVAVGEEWIAQVEGLALPRLTIKFTS